MEPLFSRSVADVDDRHMVSLRGELDLAASDGLLQWLVEIAGSTVVIDLSGLSFMDSSGIAVFVQAKSLLGNSLVLTRPQPIVRRVFEVTGPGDWSTDWDAKWTGAVPYRSYGRRPFGTAPT